MGKRDETGEYFVANLAYEVSGTKSKGTKLNPIYNLKGGMYTTAAKDRVQQRGFRRLPRMALTILYVTRLSNSMSVALRCANLRIACVMLYVLISFV